MPRGAQGVPARDPAARGPALGLEMHGVPLPLRQVRGTHLHPLPQPMGQEMVPVYPCLHQGRRGPPQPPPSARQRAPGQGQAARGTAEEGGAGARAQCQGDAAPEAAPARHLHPAQRGERLQVLGQRELVLLPGLHPADVLAGGGRRLAHRHLAREGDGAVAHARGAEQRRRPLSLDAQGAHRLGEFRAKLDTDLLVQLQQGRHPQHLHTFHRGSPDSSDHLSELPPPVGPAALHNLHHQGREAEGLRHGVRQDPGACRLAGRPSRGSPQGTEAPAGHRRVA
mmetsp:Transcript_52733/g.141231  ORF Transcript_52733/g.141231 Transcript_52733/m.141231 type:complete len:282 (-) Transcript_52733:484-1329(-)